MIQPGRTYHIYNHAVGPELLYREDTNYSFFIARYLKYIAPITDTYGWCLMPNHFHLLVRIRSSEDLQGLIDLEGFAYARGKKSPELYASQQFSNFFNSYCKAYNKMFNRRGSLFMKNFRYKPVHHYPQLLRTLIYIQLNPVKHGYTEFPDEWQWSSFGHHFDRAESRIPLSGEIASIFMDQDRYLRIHELGLHKYRKRVASNQIKLRPEFSSSSDVVFPPH